MEKLNFLGIIRAVNKKSDEVANSIYDRITKTLEDEEKAILSRIADHINECNEKYGHIKRWDDYIHVEPMDRYYMHEFMPWQIMEERAIQVNCKDMDIKNRAKLVAMLLKARMKKSQ